ncbi:MAG: AAA family ATPase [Nitrospirae bacterium]|nr:AAA family ATPase [Nitrospirota bacterium]MBF0535582.1 AAA family ATPase [Nitrospirota bacterium]MBF0617465.1 AAA family ATPase [Nitrospirota bacterium]
MDIVTDYKKYKKLNGIFLLIDLIDSTSQFNKINQDTIGFFLKYFYAEVAERAEKNNYKIVKTIYDAVAIFGTEREGFIGLCKELFVENRIRDNFDVEVKLRIVADYGFINLEINEDGDPVDYRDPKTIALSRMEKLAKTWEIVITENLSDAIEDLLTDTNSPFTKESFKIEARLKGYEDTSKYDTLHRLVVKTKAWGITSILLKNRLNKLFNDCQEIPIFGNLYEPISMEKNFLNLSLSTTAKSVQVQTGRTQSGNGDIDYRIFIRAVKDENAVTTVSASDISEKYNKGFIMGLPGAGKTTILKYMAFKIFNKNPNAIVLLVSTRDFTDYMFTGLANNNINTLLKVVFFAFLFPKRAVELDRAEENFFNEAFTEVKKTWTNGELIVLIDALDESLTNTVKDHILHVLANKFFEEIKQDKLQNSNKFFISSRQNEVDDPKQYKEFIFYVNHLKYSDIIDLSRLVMDDKAKLVKLETDALKNPGIIMVGNTPLMAMVIIKYYEHFDSFELRFNMYDIVIKFILKRIWHNLKEEDILLKEKTLLGFFEEAKDDNFFYANPELLLPFTNLSLLSFKLLYSPENEKPLREFSDKDLDTVFKEFSKTRVNESVKKYIKAKTTTWKEICKREHILISAGMVNGIERYVFMHSTMMEFLAAWHFINKEPERKKHTTLFDKNRETLETLPIALGHSFEAGRTILAMMEKHYENREDTTMPFRCLSELESLENKEYVGVILPDAKKKIDKEIEKNLKSKEWVYIWLKNLFMKTMNNTVDTIKMLGEHSVRFKTAISLSRNAFLDYIEDWADETSDIVAAREAFLTVILNESIFKEAIAMKAKTVSTETLPLRTKRSEQTDIEISIKNFGPISSGTIKLKPLTVLIGPNNSGKSYAAMMIHSLSEFFKPGAFSIQDKIFFGMSAVFGSGSINKNDFIEFYNFIDNFLITDLEDIEIPRDIIEKTYESYIKKALMVKLQIEIRKIFKSPLEQLVRINKSKTTTTIRANGNDYEFFCKKKGSGLELKAYPQLNIRIQIKINKNLNTEFSVEKIQENIIVLHIKEKSTLTPKVLLDEVLTNLIIPVDFNTLYLPASRSGVFQSYKVLASKIIEGIGEIDKLKLPGSFFDLISDLIGLPVEPGVFYTLVRDFEKDIIKGEMRLETTINGSQRPEISYIYNEHDIPLQLASSTVSELAPLFLYLKHLVRQDDILIIEEPEAHLHPENQRKIARFFVKLIRKGLKLVITTHSEYLLEQINNFMLMSKVKPEVKKTYASDDFLNPDEIGVYVFSYDKKDSGYKIKEVEKTEEDGISDEEFERVYEALYDEYVKIQRLKD